MWEEERTGWSREVGDNNRKERKEEEWDRKAALLKFLNQLVYLFV